MKTNPRPAVYNNSHYCYQNKKENMPTPCQHLAFGLKPICHAFNLIFALTTSLLFVNTVWGAVVFQHVYYRLVRDTVIISNHLVNPTK